MRNDPVARNGYGVILADPPWEYMTYSAKGSGRSALAHYDTLTIDQIAALPVGELAAPDCVLFLWVTDPHLEHGFHILRSWGFKYKTVGLYWVKLNPKGKGYFFGLGHWGRANPEQALLATRGSPKRLSAGVSKLIVSPVREHSRKPDEQYERIERLVGGPYCELFSRKTKPGWRVEMSNEAGLFDAGAVATRRTSYRDGSARRRAAG